MERAIEVLEFRDVTPSGEDGFRARLLCRISPPSIDHAFIVILSATTAASRGIGRGGADEDRELALRVMRAAALRRIEDDPRRFLPVEGEITILAEDLARLPENRP